MEEAKNEFGEVISDEMFEKISERVRALSDDQIDRLWFLCEYVYSEREQYFKAINKEKLDLIRKDQASTKLGVSLLWDETKTEEILNNLSKVENS